MVDEGVACRPRSHHPLIRFPRASSPHSSLASVYSAAPVSSYKYEQPNQYQIPGTTTSTSEIHINNMYIRYTFLLDVAVLQIRQVLWAIPLPMTFSLAVKALSIRLRSSLGLLRRRGNFLTTLLEVSLWLRLAFLEFGGLIDQQHLVLFLDLHFCRFQHGKEFWQRLVHVLHVVVHHKVLVTWW